MKILISLIGLILVLPSLGFGQINRPHSVQLAYLGEMITHPGIKLGINYEIWQKEVLKKKKNGKEKSIERSIRLGPSLGGFSHKGYQRAVFTLLEGAYAKHRHTGLYTEIGLGIGYMRSFVPQVFSFSQEGNIEATRQGSSHLLTNSYLLLGKEIDRLTSLPLSIFAKPQLMYALPNYSGGVGYFVLEVGLRYRFDQ